MLKTIDRFRGLNPVTILWQGRFDNCFFEPFRKKNSSHTPRKYSRVFRYNGKFKMAAISMLINIFLAQERNTTNIFNQNRSDINALRSNNMYWSISTSILSLKNKMAATNSWKNLKMYHFEISTLLRWLSSHI